MRPPEPAPITVLGHTGFVGSRLKAELTRRGIAFQALGRDDDLAGRDLGRVVYCIGMTADFRSRPLETVEAHVGRLLGLLRGARVERLIYLSSTRLYRGGSGREDDPLDVRPHEADDLYNISKAMGEALALHSGRPAVVVRLSNVYGPDFASENFLPSLIKAALGGAVVRLRQALDSAKDYVSVADVADALVRLAVADEVRGRVYNLAAGHNTTHSAILDGIARATGCRVEVEPDAPRAIFPVVDVSRLRAEFGYAPSALLDDLPSLIDVYARNRDQWTRSPST
jgi:nucleoside-diphosphate-sugar epimerase